MFSRFHLSNPPAPPVVERPTVREEHSASDFRTPQPPTPSVFFPERMAYSADPYARDRYVCPTCYVRMNIPHSRTSECECGLKWTVFGNKLIIEGHPPVAT